MNTRIPVRIILNLKILKGCSKNNQVSNFMKICAVGIMYHASKRKDMTNLTAVFHNFANAPKRIILVLFPYIAAKK
jgi:hypothetical protein